MILVLLLACGPTTAKVGESGVGHTGESAGESGAPSDSLPEESGGGESAVDTAGWPGPGLHCGLSSDAATPYWLEGDVVSFDVLCTDTLLTEDADIEAISIPDGATYDPDTRGFTWATGPADGGRVELVFSVTPTDGSGDVPSAEKLVFWVADNPDAADNVAVDPLTYTEEWGLPVIYVDYSGGLNTEYIPATVTFRGLTYTSSIKIRGASSAYYSKPGYTLEFNDKKLPIEEWGVKRDHLILLTTFDDNSYVRQKLVYDMWAAMADYWGEPRLTPRTFFTVVYLNGSYWGLYVGLDRIDNEYLEQMGFEKDANLYKAVNHNGNFYLTNVYGGTKSTLHEGYTKEEGLPEDDFSDLDDLVEFTGSSSVSDLLAGSGDWIDLQEFMDWFLMVHYTLAEDSAGKNSYLYHPQGGGIFRYSPWDFNHSWGQGWYTYRISATSDDYFTSTNKVFYAIQSDADADAELWERFAQMRADGPLSLAWQEAQLDEYYALIDPSAQRDWDKWDERYYTYSGWASTRASAHDWKDFEGEKDYLYQWLEDRAAYFETLHP